MWQWNYSCIPVHRWFQIISAKKFTGNNFRVWISHWVCVSSVCIALIEDSADLYSSLAIVFRSDLWACFFFRITVHVMRNSRVLKIQNSTQTAVSRWPDKYLLSAILVTRKHELHCTMRVSTAWRSVYALDRLYHFERKLTTESKRIEYHDGGPRILWPDYVYKQLYCTCV